MKRLLTLILLALGGTSFGQVTKGVPDADNFFFGDGSQATGDLFSSITSEDSPRLRFGDDVLTVVDADGNEIGEFIPVASAVNFLRATSSATGNGPTLSAVGDDANINLGLITKGTGSLIGGNSGNADFYIRHAADNDLAIRLATSEGGTLVHYDTAGNLALFNRPNGRLSVVSGAGIAWSSSATNAGGSPDTTLFRDGAAGIIAQRNGASAQVGRVYNTWTNASNGEWFEADWQTTANVARIGTNANGTGTVRAMDLQPNGGALTLAGVAIPTISSTSVLTNKTIDSGNNTLKIEPILFTGAGPHALSAAQMYNSVVYVDTTSTVTLAARADGMSFSIIADGAVTVTVDPDAGDLIKRDGTAQADGVTIVSPGAAGDVATFTDYNATGFFAVTNSWTQGS